MKRLLFIVTVFMFLGMVGTGSYAQRTSKSNVGAAVSSAMKKRDDLNRHLLDACRTGNLVTVKHLVNEANVNFKNEIGETPLSMAIKHGHFEVVKVLVDKGADLNGVESLIETSLTLAIKNRRYEMIPFFIEKGVDINKPDFVGETPLILLVDQNRLQEVSVLLQAGAKVNMKSEVGETPLVLAAEKGSVEMVKLLLAYGADVNDASYFKRAVDSPLDAAARGKHPEIVRILLDNGASLRGQGEKAFFTAAEYGDLQTLGIFLERGIDVNTLNTFGNTVLIEAARRNKVDVVRFLVRVEGIDLNVRDRFNKTALDHAYKNSEVAHILEEAMAK